MSEQSRVISEQTQIKAEGGSVSSQLPKADASAPTGASAGALGLATRTKFAFVRGFYALAMHVLTLNGLYQFARFWGLCEWMINYRWRHRFRKRLVHIFGSQISETDIRRHTRKHITRIRCDKTFYTILDRIPRHRFAERVKWTGREHLDASVARGKGTYILFSHHGSHHVGGLMLALLGYRKLAAIRDPNEGALRLYIQEQFAQTFPEFRNEITIFMAGEGSPRELYRFLQGNGILGSGLDVEGPRSEQSRTAQVTLFGNPHTWLTGTVHVALRTQSTILPGFVVSEPNFVYRYIILPPLVDPDSAKDTPQTVQQVMDAYAAGIERHVRKYPDHISKTK